MKMQENDFNFEDLLITKINKNSTICDPKSADKVVDDLNADQIAYSAWNCAWIPPEEN